MQMKNAILLSNYCLLLCLVSLHYAAITTGVFYRQCPYEQAVCCPTPVNAKLPCGNDLGRGYCARAEDISMGVETYWSKYTHMCFCNGNFDGIDCSSCKHGFTGKDCTEKVVSVRKDIQLLTSQQKSLYAKALQKMNNNTSVFILKNNDPIDVFHAFGVIHALTIKNGFYKLAHSSPSFLPWHRWFLILFEDQLHIHGWPKNLGVPFWNWTNLDDTYMQKHVFTPDLMGNMDGNKFKNFEVTTGVASGWPVYDEYGKVFSKLKRNNGEEQFIAPTMPDPKETQELLAFKGPYDSYPFSAHSHGFRSLIEGAPWGPGAGNWTWPTSLHARVHEYIGGTIGEVSISANDPLFFSHHSYVDLLFEAWRSNNLNATYPDDCKVVGSGKHETMPFLFPWRTNNDMYIDIATFGYSYQGVSVTSSPSLSEPLQQVIILGLFVLALALVLFLFMKIKW